LFKGHWLLALGALIGYPLSINVLPTYFLVGNPKTRRISPEDFAELTRRMFPTKAHFAAVCVCNLAVCLVLACAFCIAFAGMLLLGKGQIAGWRNLLCAQTLIAVLKALRYLVDAETREDVDDVVGDLSRDLREMNRKGYGTRFVLVAIGWNVFRSLFAVAFASAGRFFHRLLPILRRD
jgi:hypothetical protein